MGIAHESIIKHLFPVWSLFIEWLFITHPPPLTGEQYGKMEQKYPEQLV